MQIFESGAHTVDGNGNGLGQLIAVCSSEGWDLAEFVELQVFGGWAAGIDFNLLEVELVSPWRQL